MCEHPCLCGDRRFHYTELCVMEASSDKDCEGGIVKDMRSEQCHQQGGGESL